MLLGGSCLRMRRAARPGGSCGLIAVDTSGRRGREQKSWAEGAVQAIDEIYQEKSRPLRAVQEGAR